MIDLSSTASLVLWLWRSLHAKRFKRDWAARDATGIVISPGSLTRTAERNASANPETSISWSFGLVPTHTASTNVLASRHHTRVANCSSDGSADFNEAAAVEARLARPDSRVLEADPHSSHGRSPLMDRTGTDAYGH